MTRVSAANSAEDPRDAGPETEPAVEPLDDPPQAVFRDLALLTRPPTAGPAIVLPRPQPEPTGDEDHLLFTTHGLPEWIEAVPCDTDGGPAEAADVTGLDEFFHANQARISRKLAVLFAGDLNHAEDVVQEAFIIAYRHWPRISQMANPYGYVACIAWNLGLRWLRKQRRERETCAQQVGAADTGNLAPGAELRLDLRRALDLLPEQQQVVMGLSLLGYRNDEIGEIIGVPSGTARTRLHRARKSLKRLLDAPGDEEEGGTGRRAGA